MRQNLSREKACEYVKNQAGIGQSGLYFLGRKNLLFRVLKKPTVVLLGFMGHKSSSYFGEVVLAG